MYIVTGQQSTDEVVCLATGSATIVGLRVYNPSSSVVNVEVRAYDYSKSLEIGLSRHSVAPDSTIDLGGREIILNDLDEAYVSGNSSNENLQYTYGLSGDSSKTFIALQYYDDDSEYLNDPSFTPPNVVIKAFNTNSSTAELILQAHEDSASRTNNNFARNIPPGEFRSVGYPPFESYDYSLADNAVAHPFDLCIYRENSPSKEYGSFTHSAGTQQIGNWSNIYVQKQFQIYNITRGTANPVDVHIEFLAATSSNPPVLPTDSNVIQVTGTDTDSNGNVTDAYIAWYQGPNKDWGSTSSNGGGWDFWDVGSYRNQDGSIKGTAVNSIGYSGTAPGYTRDNSATGYIEIQFFLEGQFATRPVPAGTPYQRLMTTANTTYTNINNGSGRSCIGGAGRNCGLTPTQNTYYNSFVPYDPVREGYWLDLGGDGPPVSQDGWF